MQTVRYGIIGTGNIARSTHIRCLQNLEGAEIAAVCDHDPAMLEGGRQITGAPIAVVNVAELLAIDELDAVVICTPNDTHAEIAVQALERGKHVLCEKPMATTPQDCDRMIRAADVAGKTLQIAQPYRYSPFYRKMRSLIEGGVLGRVEMAWTKEFMRWGDVAPSDKAWRMYQGRSGGALVEKNCHHLDLMNWMIDSEPVRVSAFGGKNCFQKPEIIDHAVLICEYANGAKAMLLLSLFQSKGMIDLEVGVVGAEGRIETFDQSEMYLYQRPDDVARQCLQQAGWTGDEIRRLWPSITSMQAWADPVAQALPPAQKEDLFRANELWLRNWQTKRPENITVPSEDVAMHSGATALHRDFIDSLRTGRRPFCDARVGKASIIIGVAGELSIKEGRTVEIEEIL